MSRNIFANIAGKFWSILSNILFLPLYIRLLGIDNYAVISLSMVVAGVLMILDIGLSVTIAREMARTDTQHSEKYITYRTLEKMYLLLLLICVCLGLFFARPIAVYFINDTPVNRDLISLCLKVIACEAGLQIFFRFYVSAMMGLERQVEANLFNVGWGVVRNGLVVVLMLVTPSLVAFFTWQLIATLLLLLVTKRHLDRILAPWRPAVLPLIDWTSLRRVRDFAVGILLISIIASVNSQLDRVVLSHLLDLQYLGYYTIAVSIGTGMLMMSAPFVSTIQPRLTKWFSEGRTEEARDLYVHMATLVAILVFPLMAVIGINAEMVVMAWTGNVRIAEGSSGIVPWVVASYALLAMSSMTYSVALANGYTRYNNIIGVVTLFVSIPGYWLMVGRFGAVGAAALFLVIQFGVSTSYHILIDRRFLKLGIVRTYVQLFLCPAAIAALLAGALHWSVGAPQQSRPLMLAYLGVAYMLVLAGTGVLISVLFRLRWRLSELAVA